MRYSTRLGLAVGFMAAVTIAGAAVAQVGDDAPAPTLDGPAASDGKAFFGLRHGGFGMGRDLVTGSATFETEDGFVTRRMDSGIVTTAGGDSVTIERADGEPLTVTIDDGTQVRRDHDEATLDDLEPGDHAHIVQVDEGDGMVVMGVMALSPDAYEERERRIEEWQERTQDRRDRRHDRFERFRHRFGDTDDDADAEPTSA